MSLSNYHDMYNIHSSKRIGRIAMYRCLSRQQLFVQSTLRSPKHFSRPFADLAGLLFSSHCNYERQQRAVNVCLPRDALSYTTHPYLPCCSYDCYIATISRKYSELAAASLVCQHVTGALSLTSSRRLILVLSATKLASYPAML
jgi:hypothetical protein